VQDTITIRFKGLAVFTYNRRDGTPQTLRHWRDTGGFFPFRQDTIGRMMVDVLRVADGHKRICSKTDEELQQVGCWCYITVMACVWTRMCRFPSDNRPPTHEYRKYDPK
jgi:hypothetical protein